MKISAKRFLAISPLSFLLCSALFALLLLLGGCLATMMPTKIVENCPELPGLSDDSRISLFLNLGNTAGPKLRLVVAEVEVLAGAEWLPLSGAAKTIETGSGGNGQFLLGSRLLPAGMFSAVRLTFAGAQKIGAGANSSFTIEQSVIELALDDSIDLTGQTNRLIFVNWDVDRSLMDDRIRSLAFYVSGDQGVIVSSNLSYVACPEIDTVYIVRTDNNRVTGAISIPGGPTYIYADNRNKKLFILAAADSTINIVHMVSGLITDRIKIPFVVDPIFMVLDSDAESAFVLDRRGTIVKMDLQQGIMVTRNRIGQDPAYLLYMHDLEKLAVSSTLDNMVYLVNPDSLEILEAIRFEGRPLGLLVWDDLLYVAENDLNYVSIYDLNQRKILNRVSVGFRPARLTIDQDNIYVTNAASASLSLLKGLQFHVSKEILIGDSPLELAVAEFQRFLYVGRGDCPGSITVVDLSSNQMVAEIELGAKPVGMAVIQ